MSPVESEKAMTETPEGALPPQTPESVKAAVKDEPAPPDSEKPQSGEQAQGPGAPASGSTGGSAEPPFNIGDGVTRGLKDRPTSERLSDRPPYRPLKIFALDPSVSRLEGATALVNVPYERLEPGPKGRIFWVRDEEQEKKEKLYVPLDLENENILIRNGIDPSTSDIHFQNQMVYAVCSIVYTAFRTALGRHITWGFNKPDDKKPEEKTDDSNTDCKKTDDKKIDDTRAHLIIRPRALKQNNSHYDKSTGELCFGYYRSQAQGEFQGTVYACLSHDTVAHEVTHALLDGLRAHFSLPFSQDVLAFHEGFADLVAVFQHFSYEQVVRAAIRNSHGQISRAALLTDIARQLGQTGRQYKTALRSAIDFAEEKGEVNDGGKQKKSPKLYHPNLEPHDLGSVLVISVFEAFIAVFRRKTERLVRLATNGSGRLPPGELSSDLQAALAEKASKLASQFLTMCIRAIDYCPPVDITFSEYLRAVITADKDLVPDDPWAYREAWIDSFRRHHIYPSASDVKDLSEDSLLWLSPEKQSDSLCLLPIRGLRFGRLRFRGDPAWPASEQELKRQAKALGEIVIDPNFRSIFGLAKKGDKALKGDQVNPPKIQSIRTSRRVGPSGQVVFDIVAEVTQKRTAEFKATNEKCTFYGGSTIIIDPDGRIRYVIRKSITDNDRKEEQKKFLDSPRGLKYKPSLCDTQRPNLFQMLHEEEALKPKAPPFPFFL